MQRYCAGDGFGAAGLAVTDGGRVYRFARPVTRFLVKIPAGQGVCYVGFNEAITDVAAENAITGAPTDERDRVGSITKAVAQGKGVPVAAGESLVLECPIDPLHGRRGIYCVWFICQTGVTSNVTGGVVGM